MPAIERNGFIVYPGNQTAKQPADRIGEADPKYRIGDVVGHDIQIDLPEYDEGANHDKHRRTGVSGAAERARINLMNAAEQIERRNEPQKDRSVPDYFGRSIEERNDRRRKYHDGDGRNGGHGQGDQQCDANALFRPFQIICADVLTDECR